LRNQLEPPAVEAGAAGASAESRATRGRHRRALAGPCWKQRERLLPRGERRSQITLLLLLARFRGKSAQRIRVHQPGARGTGQEDFRQLGAAARAPARRERRFSHRALRPP